MLRPRRRLVLEDEGETVDVAKPGGVGDTGCENISLGSDRQRVLLFFFPGGAPFSGGGAVAACCK